MRPAIFIILIFFARPAWSVEHRRLESVELRADETGSWVELKTDRPANFTSFKLDAPARIVVDFPETTAAATDHEVATAGLVRGWAFKTLGDGASPVVRLTVALRDDADYTLTANGARISLRLLPATGRPLVALDGERRAAEPPGPPPVRVAVAKIALTNDVQGGVPAAAAFAAPSSVAQPPLPVIVLQKTPAAVPTAKADGVPVAMSPVERVAVVRGGASSARPTSLRVDSVNAHPLAPLRKASLEQIAFRRTPHGARIVLRTSQPVRWVLVEESDEVVFIELEDTQILASRNRLPLDTRFFKTPVTRIVPSEEAVLQKTRVAVEVSPPARWTAFADGPLVVLEVSSVRSASHSVGDEIW